MRSHVSSLGSMLAQKHALYDWLGWITAHLKHGKVVGTVIISPNQIMCV